jgi:hypothetical protein
MEKGLSMFQENDDGKYFSVVKSGILELLIIDERKKLFKEWDCLGACFTTKMQKKRHSKMRNRSSFIRIKGFGFQRINSLNV